MSEPDLIIHRGETANGVVALTISGEVDLASSARFKRAFDAELDRFPPPREVHADLAAVDFMDSMGVAVLLHARERARERGSRLVVTSTSPFLDRLFQVSGIDRLIG
jgi:anti-anti-sigma factor